MELTNMPTFFCNTITAQKNDYINLLQVGWDKCTPRYSYSHYRDMYIIHFVKSGMGTIETEGHKYTVCENDAFIIRPHILTVQTADEMNPFELYFFAFSGDFADELVEKTVFKNNTVTVSFSNDSPCQIITDMAIELNENPYSEIHTLKYLFELISYFDTSNSLFTIKNDEQDIYQKYITSVQEYIQFNYSKSIKISDIANQLNINRSHLYRIFKRITGNSIEDYLVSVRINAARSLLEDTDFSAAAISALVGYSHYSTFFKIFKGYTGLTPKEYRIKYNGEEQNKK